MDVHCAIHELDGSVEVGLRHDGEVLETERIAPADGRKHFRFMHGPLDADLSLGVENASGAVHIAGRLAVRVHDRWHEVADLDEVVCHIGPAHGAVGGDPEPHPPQLDDARFGRSRMSSKNVTRFFVEDRKRVLANVGQVVKRALWTDLPDWVFNTVACVGEFDSDGRGAYTDPDSIWFNVFLGYYQIDAPKPAWDRPFAYESAEGERSRIRFEEIVRLGKSDWGYFSNWMYGVPEDVVEAHDGFDLSALRTTQGPTEAVGSSLWHRGLVEGVDFVSAYESDAEEAARLTHNAPISGLWRNAFGQPNPRGGYAESFIGTTMDAAMYIAYWEDADAFHTTIFGGTAPTGGDPAFLDAQMEVSREVIEGSYPELGF